MLLNSLKCIIPIIILIVTSSCSNNSNNQIEVKQEADLLFEADSTKVFSRDLSYYDPNNPLADYKKKYNFPPDLEAWYQSLINKMRQSPKDSIRYSNLVLRLRQYPVYVEMPYGENKEIKHLTLPYGVYLDYSMTLPSANNQDKSNKDAATFILTNMSELCSRIDHEGGKYYIIHDLWVTCDYQKKLKLITSVADAHATLEGKVRKISFIDDQTGSKIAEASPTRGIQVLDEESN